MILTSLNDLTTVAYWGIFTPIAKDRQWNAVIRYECILTKSKRSC
jgi:hypothetical protein